MLILKYIKYNQTKLICFSIFCAAHVARILQTRVKTIDYLKMLQVIIEKNDMNDFKRSWMQSTIY